MLCHRNVSAKGCKLLQRAQPLTFSPFDATPQRLILASLTRNGTRHRYRVLVNNLNESDETADLASGEIDPQIKCPVLAIDSAPGRTSLPGFMEGSMQPFATDIRYRTAKTEGHWVQIESRDEVNAWIEEFLREVGG